MRKTPGGNENGTLQSIERNIRANNLRGHFDGMTHEEAIASHRIPDAVPDLVREMERLEAIEAEMQAAASRGDTVAIRRLIAEKESIEAARDRRTEAALAELSARTIAAPEPGEEKRVVAQAKALGRQISRKTNERQKLLLALAKQPDCENLLTRVERIDEWLRDAQPEVEALTAKQNRFAAWHQQQEESGELEKFKKETKRQAEEREADEKRMADLAEHAAAAWKNLTESLREFEIIVARRMRAAGLRRQYEPLEKTSETVRTTTNGGCTRTEGIHGFWTISGRVRPEVPE